MNAAAPEPPPSPAATSDEDLVALLLHELRGPMMPLLAAADLVERSTDAAVVARSREVIGRQVEHLRRLMDRMQEVARVASGRIELRREPLELRLVMEHAVGSARELLEARRHRIECRCPTAPITVRADPVRLAEAIGCLVENAARFTPAGGEVRLTAAREHHSAVVRVQDNGVGLAPQLVPRLFRFFTRFDSGGGAAPAGLGVGLAVARRLVELHGGTVEARSAGIGLGSEFVVRLPTAGGGA